MALFDTRPSAEPYLYEVHYQREEGLWTEGSSGNGPGWHLLDPDTALGVETTWGEAPPGADRVRVDLDGETQEEAVSNGVYLAVWWDVACPTTHAEPTAFRVSGEWVRAPTLWERFNAERPSGWFMLIIPAMPVVSVAIAAALTGMSALTAVLALAALLVAMAAAGQFVMSWIPPQGSSGLSARLKASFVLWLDEGAKPNRLQHWYAPVSAAGAAGALSELVQLVIRFTRLGVSPSAMAFMESAGVGVLEGVLVSLAFAAGYGLVPLIPVVSLPHSSGQ